MTLRRVSVLAALMCVLAAVASSPATAASRCAHASASPAHISATAAARAVRCLVNLQRRRFGLPAVRVDPRLERAAGAFAQDMVTRDYFAHVSPDGTTMDQRVRRAGYLDDARSWSLGEAIAWGEDGAGAPRSIVRGLLNSPPHRAILLDGGFRDVGIGVARGAPAPDGHTALTVALDFGRVSR